MQPDRFDPTTRYPPNKILSMIPGSASFPLLELILDPTHHFHLPIQDAILVAIDLECRVIEDLGMRITQVGIVSLDTRNIADVSIDDSQSLRDAVQSRVFSVYPKKVSRKSWVPTSLWASPEKIEHDEISSKLLEILMPPESRDIVLIGHSIHSDRSLLIKLCNFDIKQVKSITAILDTGRMMCCAYDLGIATHSHFPLRLILRYLGVPYNHLHDAGNDAMFTLKAALLMFCNWKYQKGRHIRNIADDAVTETQISSTAKRLRWDRLLEILTAIAREPWPARKKPVRCMPVLTRPSRPMKTQTVLLFDAEDLDLRQLYS